MAKRYNIIQVSGTKAVTLWGDEGWVNLSGNQAEKLETEGYFSSRVAIVFRAMQLRANAVASIPFDIVNANTGAIIDSTDEWKNECGFMPNPEALFWLIEAGWTIHGRGYIYQNANPNGFKKIFKYLSPETVIYDAEKDIFTRNNKEFLPAIDKNGKVNKQDSIVSLWMPDPDVEKGPPLKYPGKAALQAMGVLFNLDTASTEFFKRGMLDAYIVSVPPGTQEADIQKLESTFKDKLQGVRHFFRAIFVKADKIDVQNIGGSLQSIAQIPLTKEKREDVSIALGVPMTKLFSDSAAGLGGGGVVDADDRRLIADTALPEWKNMARQLNEQVFLPMGWKLQEHHEKMEVFQENQGTQGTTLQTYQTAYQTNPKTFPVFAEILGITFTDAQLAKLKPEEVKPPEPVIAVTQPNPVVVDNNPVDTTPAKSIDPEYTKEMSRYQRKALKHIGESVSFESDIIPADVLLSIKESLPECKTEDAVKSLFAIKSTVREIDIDEASNIIDMLRLNLKSIETNSIKAVEQPIYNFTMPAITLNAQMPELGQPEVVVNIPEQPATVVNVTNEVNPTPVTIENNVEIPTAQTLTVKRDKFNQITSVEKS